jgi:mannan endo-1,4-beta-mannosidase
MESSSSSGSGPLDRPSRRTVLTTVALTLATAAIPGTAAFAADLPPVVPEDLLPRLATRARFGSWARADSGLIQDHLDLERLVRTKLPVFSWFQNFSAWQHGLTDKIAAIDPAEPYDCMICWEPFGIPFSEILSGVKDDYFREYFDGAKKYPGRVIIRLFHEPNGNWYPWSVASRRDGATSTEQWKRAWTRIVWIARNRGADNVRFMFCANQSDVGGIPIEDYWPGAEWVDIIGVDGYNWGWNLDGTPFQTAEDLIAPMYDRLTRLHQTAEFMVGEISSAAHPNKALWFKGLYKSRNFARLTQVVLFNENKEQDWRLNSDAETLRVSRRYLGLAPQLLDDDEPGTD